MVTVTDPAKENVVMEAYQYTVRVGDVVQLPASRCSLATGPLAIVTRSEFVCAGHSHEVTVKPLTMTWLRRVFRILGRRDLFYDSEINRLTRLSACYA